jgi:hypothetical protein
MIGQPALIAKAELGRRHAGGAVLGDRTRAAAAILS